MKNADFPLAAILAALDALGIAFTLHRVREPRPLRFCSTFAPEAGGLFFWDGEAAPALAQRDIVVLVARPFDIDVDCQVEVAHPQRAYYLLMRHFFAAPPAPETTVHPTAVVSARARLGDCAYVGPYCVIGDCEIGARTRLESHVVVMDGSTIGADTTVESHSTVGATGVAWVEDPLTGERIVQPQIGGARIGDRCFIGTDVTVVRGSINEVTSLGDGCVVAHGTKIGHGCVIGRDVHFANNVSIAGNCRIGDRAFLGAASVLRPRIAIARGVVVGAGAVVTRDVPEEGQVVSGVPARAMAAKSRHSGVPGRTHQETSHVRFLPL